MVRTAVPESLAGTPLPTQISYLDLVQHPQLYFVYSNLPLYTFI